MAIDCKLHKSLPYTIMHIINETSRVCIQFQAYIFLFVLMTLKTIVFLRRRYTIVVLKKQRPARSIVFPEITRKNADDNLLGCVKFLINYGFYKFGVEVSLSVLILFVDQLKINKLPF